MFYEQSLLSQDPDFFDRVAACSATELDWTQTGARPTGWTATNIWLVAAAPGFAEAYSSAIAASVPNPGRDESVISDDQIRAAIQDGWGGTPVGP